jgi:hypothetical protein
MIVPSVVLADGYVKVSPSTMTITKGTTSTINVTASNAAGRIDITNSNSSVASISGENPFFVDNESKTFTVTGLTAGTTTITFKLSDVATYSDEELHNSYTVKVTVIEPQQVQTTTPVPTTKKTTVPRTTKQGTIVVEPAPVEETTTTEMTTEVIAEAPKEDLVVNSFKIVGYDINFDSNNLEYTIDVYKDVNELYIIVDGENLNVVNNGLVNIDNLSNIKVLVSNGIVQKEYTININRVGEKQTTSNRGLIVCIVVLSIFTLLISSVSLYYYVIRKK